MQKRIFISASTFGSIDPAPINKLQEAGFEVVRNPLGKKLAKEDSLKFFQGFDGLIAGLETLDEEVMEKTGIKVISRSGSGLSNVDLTAAKKLGIKVCSTPIAPVDAVAELTIGAMLSLLRCIPQLDHNVHNGAWTKQIGHQLSEKSVLIIGYGRIGRRITELLKPFRAKILVSDPALKETEYGPVHRLENLLPLADIITFHCSGDNEILGEEQFALLKPGAYILNCARGQIVNENALIKSIESGIVAGAWLDVFSEEPYRGNLTRYPQVILTPHAGSYTEECRRVMEMEAADNLIAAFNHR